MITERFLKRMFPVKGKKNYSDREVRFYLEQFSGVMSFGRKSAIVK